jgi:hypothetical protein
MLSAAAAAGRGPPEEGDATIAAHLLRIRDEAGRPLPRMRMWSELSIFFFAGARLCRWVHAMGHLQVPARQPCAWQHALLQLLQAVQTCCFLAGAGNAQSAALHAAATCVLGALRAIGQTAHAACWHAPCRRGDHRPLARMGAVPDHAAPGGGGQDRC